MSFTKSFNSGGALPAKPGKAPYWVRKVYFFYKRFPPQLWFVFLGNFIIAIGSSMAWPYLNIFIRQRLDLPLHLSTLLTSTRALTGILASLTVGSFSDKSGRRGIMLVSVIGGFLYHALMPLADHAWEFILLLAAWGALDNFYSVGSNAMIVDMTDRDNQLDAFALNRMTHNTGIAIGPIIGGILATRSYRLNFGFAAGFFSLAVILVMLFVKESLNKPASHSDRPQHSANPTRMVDVLRDYVFMMSVGFLVLITVGTSTVFNLLPLYARETYAIPESRISIVFTVNALICVFLQLTATQFTARQHPFRGLIVSAALYGVAIAGYALIPSVLWYCICMAVMTFGEIILSPTMMAFTARRAPIDARARYMGLYNLAYPVGYAIGPAIAGLIFEYVAPQAIWINGGIFCLIAMVGFMILYRVSRGDRRLVHHPDL